MFTSFLKVTLRNLYREKVYALINISGLALAIACCLILGLYLRSEFTYNHHNVKYKQIFRIIHTDLLGDTRYTPSVLPSLLARDYPEIKGFVRFGLIGQKEEPFIRHGDKVFQWKDIWYADDNVFDVFTHDIICGDPKTALVDPTSVAVSESFSNKYFGDANPVGETISFNKKAYKIKLVFADLPDNTSLKYDILVSYHEKELADAETSLKFYKSNCVTYLLMPQSYKAQDFKPISDSISSRYLQKEGLSTTEYKYWLQPLADIYFNSDVAGEHTANKFYIYGFAVVAIFILLVACINYMNLATARAAKRAKEVGMRKIMGAGRLGLRLQFLAEAVFFSLIALFFGLVLVEIALNLTPINELLNKPLTLNLSREPVLLVWMLVFSLVIGVMSGIYPAVYLSSMPPLSALALGHRAGKGSIRFRQLLVLVQFAITVTVIACTLLMALQMRYVSRKPLGFEKENRVIITLYGTDLIDKIPTIKTELSKNSSILGITLSNLKHGQGAGPLKLVGMDNEDVEISYLLVEDNYFEEMGMQLVSGRDFSKRLLSDIGNSVIVNEAAVKKMGWDEPLGKSMLHFRVVGVVKDFNYRSLHSPVEPLVLIKLSYSDFANLFRYRQLILHISGEDIPGTLAFLQEKFAEFDPEHPFQFEFLDESLDKLYLSDQQAMELIGVFATICILISCLGLFGLAAFTTEQRTKEIGVRKVLGASTWQIITMLSHRILLLVLGGAIIASLAAYYAMDEWLTSFAYRTSINPFVFLLSAALAAGVAFVTVALQSYKTAHANPVEALRYE